MSLRVVMALVCVAILNLGSYAFAGGSEPRDPNEPTPPAPQCVSGHWETFDSPDGGKPYWVCDQWSE